MEKKMQLRPILSIVFGCGSFLILADALWWVGFIFALAALVLGSFGLKKMENKQKKLCAIGVMLGVSAALIYVIMSVTAGVVVVSTL